MTDPLLEEPFLRRPAPRCLADRRPPPEAHDDTSQGRLRPVRWPLRTSFERWGARLLRVRSGNGY